MMYENCFSFSQNTSAHISLHTYTYFGKENFNRNTRQQLTVRNLAMLIFSLSSEPVTSANAVSLSAGGPTGISIMANHRMGSSERMPVRLAMIQIVEMLILEEGGELSVHVNDLKGVL